MIFQLLVLLAVLSQAFAGCNSCNTKVSASIKDTSVGGLEGFNIKFDAPFKWQDYIVGFRYALGDWKRAPQSLFAKRTFDANGNGKATLEAEYNVEDSNLNLVAKFSSAEHGFEVIAKGDTKNRFTCIKGEKKLQVQDNKLTINTAYDILTKKLSGKAKLEADETIMAIEVDSEARDPILSVTRTLDDQNEVSPTLSLKTGDISYGYKRRWAGGSLAARLFPGEKVAIEWKDEGSQGTWTTTAEVPLADASSTKVTFARDWNY